MTALSFRRDIEVSPQEHASELVDLFTCAQRIRARGIPESEVPRAYSDELSAKPPVCPVKEGAAATAKERKLAAEYDGKASELEEAGDYDGAIAAMVSALGFDRSPPYLRHMAQIYEKKGDLPNAVRYLKDFAASAPPAERAAAEQKIASLEQRERERLASGTLVIEANLKGAEVRIDGLKVGGTPIAPQTVSVGSHKVQVNAKGYLPYEETIAVKSAQRKTLRIKLLPEPKKGTLTLAVTEVGAIVRVDGKEIGVAPLQKSMELLVGTHEIVVEKEPEFLPFTRSVEIFENETANVLAKLKPVPEIEPPSAFGWVLLASAGALAGGGAVLGLLSEQEKNSLDDEQINPDGAFDSITQVQAQEAEDRSSLYGTIAVGLFAGAGAALIGGTLIVIFTGGAPVEVDTESGVQADLLVSPSSIGVSVRY